MPEKDSATAVMFSINTAVSRKSRYTMGATRPTAEGGKVGVGVDNNNNAFLVHEIGRNTEAVALGAVATAIAGGAIPVDAIVSAFKETGALDALAAAAAAGLDAPAAEATETETQTTGRRRAA